MKAPSREGGQQLQRRGGLLRVLFRPTPHTCFSPPPTSPFEAQAHQHRGGRSARLFPHPPTHPLTHTPSPPHFRRRWGDGSDPHTTATLSAPSGRRLNRGGVTCWPCGWPGAAQTTTTTTATRSSRFSHEIGATSVRRRGSRLPAAATDGLEGGARV